MFTYTNKNMKAKCILSFFLLFTMLAFGQADRRDQIKAIKSSRIAAALSLTSLESQKFWPLYLNWEEKTYDAENKIQQLLSKLGDKNVDALSPKEAQLYLTQIENDQEEISNLRRKLVSDLKPVIGVKKILKLKIAEDDFNKLLVKKIKGKKD